MEREWALMGLCFRELDEGSAALGISFRKCGGGRGWSGRMHMAKACACRIDSFVAGCWLWEESAPARSGGVFARARDETGAAYTH